MILCDGCGQTRTALSRNHSEQQLSSWRSRCAPSRPTTPTSHHFLANRMRACLWLLMTASLLRRMEWAPCARGAGARRQTTTGAEFTGCRGVALPRALSPGQAWVQSNHHRDVGGVSVSTTVTVTAAIVTSIGGPPANASIAKLSTVLLTTTCTFSDGNTSDCTAR
jgi:hypothetical protein